MLPKDASMLAQVEKKMGQRGGKRMIDEWWIGLVCLCYGYSHCALMKQIFVAFQFLQYLSLVCY